MIINKALIDSLLDEMKEKARMLEYYLLDNLFQCRLQEIVDELKKYRNEDGGFGHGLEPDVQLPLSSVVCTDMAVQILEEVVEDDFKDDLIEGIVAFYEKSYKQDIEGWELVPKEVDDYPHAIWWNYDSVGTFSYGNPNPEIIGFLYQNKRYLKQLNIDFLVNKVLTYIKDVFPSESRKHNIMSCLLFYNKMPVEIQSEIHDILQIAIDKELENENWEEYCLEPYEIANINKSFLDKHLDLLEKNKQYCYNKLRNGLPMPNWSWNQYDEVFDFIKYHWSGVITFNLVKTLLY